MKRLIDLMLYGNIWIALAATASCWQGLWLFDGAVTAHTLLLAVFFATWMVYNWHRLRTSQVPSQELRITTAKNLRPALRLFLVFSILGLVYTLTKLPKASLLGLILPGAVALGYVLPLFLGRRLRDWPYLKIFLVSSTWAWVSVVLPSWHLEVNWSVPAWWMLAERFGFFFALTLLFDWRDCQLDRSLNLRSLPQRLGLMGTQILGFGTLTLCAGFAILNTHGQLYSLGTLGAILTSLSGAGILYLCLPRLRHDYFFSGATDGLILLQALLVWIFSAASGTF